MGMSQHTRNRYSAPVLCRQLSFPTALRHRERHLRAGVMQVQKLLIRKDLIENTRITRTYDA